MLQSMESLQMGSQELLKYIRELAGEKSIVISRRTVAKYREELGIPCAFSRKK